MRPRLCLLAGLAFSLLAGCKQTSKDPPAYPADPLLLSKKPAEEPGRPTERMQLAAAEPDLLPFPATAEAARPGPRLAAQPAAWPRGPAPVRPAVRSRARDSEPAACFAHAPDHSWLQGILDKHYEGHFYLRFDDPTADHPWGGKVRLEDDPRLQRYRDGDQVRIEGIVLPELGSVPASWSSSPRYRIRSIRPIPSHS